MPFFLWVCLRLDWKGRWGEFKRWVTAVLTVVDHMHTPYVCCIQQRPQLDRRDEMSVLTLPARSSNAVVPIVCTVSPSAPSFSALIRLRRFLTRSC